MRAPCRFSGVIDLVHVLVYLGQLVERAPVDKLFSNPSHPHTRALLSAIPSIDLDHPMERERLEGEISSPINPEPGCRFARRCRYATPECSAHDISLREIDQDHFIACHRAAMSH